ncbi:hypothetical protein CLAIMM_09080, partial [Cladophialophora immunda]
MPNHSHNQANPDLCGRCKISIVMVRRHDCTNEKRCGVMISGIHRDPQKESELRRSRNNHERDSQRYQSIGATALEWSVEHKRTFERFWEQDRPFHKPAKFSGPKKLLTCRIVQSSACSSKDLPS